MKKYTPKKSKIQKAKVINTVRSFNAKITRTLKKKTRIKRISTQQNQHFTIF